VNPPFHSKPEPPIIKCAFNPARAISLGGVEFSLIGAIWMKPYHSPKCGIEKPGCLGVGAISTKPAGRLRNDVAQYPAPRINPERPCIPARKRPGFGPIHGEGPAPCSGRREVHSAKTGEIFG
jgi:hypothetical protein